MRRLVIWKDGYALFWCPACGTAHAIGLSPGQWSLEGNAESPMTQPSIRVIKPHTDETLCHCYLEGEKIRFCADSPHELAGQTVDLPFFPMNHLSEEQIAELAPL